MEEGELEKLVRDSTRATELIEGSCVRGADYETWEKQRRFIAETIHHSGSIIDIGCANGFLLRCLQEWSEYALTPYGIDVNEESIDDAKKLFSNLSKNFEAVSFRDFLAGKHGLPETYDFIYWNVWDDWYFDENEKIQQVRVLLEKVNLGGRLVLGFYDAEKAKNCNRVNQLTDAGFELNDVVENPSGDSQLITYIEK